MAGGRAITGQQVPNLLGDSVTLQANPNNVSGLLPDGCHQRAVVGGRRRHGAERLPPQRHMARTDRHRAEFRAGRATPSRSTPDSASRRSSAPGSPPTTCARPPTGGPARARTRPAFRCSCSRASPRTLSTAFLEANRVTSNGHRRIDRWHGHVEQPVLGHGQQRPRQRHRSIVRQCEPVLRRTQLAQCLVPRRDRPCERRTVGSSRAKERAAASMVSSTRRISPSAS